MSFQSIGTASNYEEEEGNGQEGGGGDVTASVPPPSRSTSDLKHPRPKAVSPPFKRKKGNISLLRPP